MKRFSLAFSIFAMLLAMLAPAAEAAAQAAGDLRRRTIAITYFRDPVQIRLAGTTLRPQARGEATVERWRKRNTSEIDIKIENVVPAFNYGGDYNTYVLWAITPAGQVDNLGEFRLSGDSARLKTATPHQTFAMIVTAEPHYLVRLPSKKIILENLTPTTNKVQVQATEVFFEGDSGKFYVDTSIPDVAERDYARTPMELLQARTAVRIARLADGERFAPNDYAQSVRFLEQAEAAFRRGASVHEVGRIARDAITNAVRTRDIAEERALAAERRSEIARRDAEIRRATENASGLENELNETQTRLRASEIARQNAEEQLARALREAADARAENRTLRNENDQMRAELQRLTRDLESARTQVAALQSQYTSTSERLESIERAERERNEAAARRARFAELQAALAKVSTVRPSGAGFVLVLPDNFFVANQTSLALRVKAKMDALGQTLAAYPGFAFVIEGHSDQRVGADSFALGRAQSVADYVAAFGLARDIFRVESRGATVPVASNKTARGKASNRRVELVFAGPQ